MDRWGKNQTSAPALTGRRFNRLHRLIFKWGGVAGAARRIIRKQPGLFTSLDIRGALTRQYPDLEPARHQLQDIMESLVQRRVIECVLCDEHSKIYKQAPRQLYFNFHGPIQ